MCAAADIREYRIPNQLLALAAAAACMRLIWPFILTGGWGQMYLSLGSFILRGMLVVLCFFPFYILRMTGAGDVKVLAFTAAWLGFYKGFLVLCIGVLMGAVLALLKLIRQGGAASRFLYLKAYFRRLFREKKIQVYNWCEKDGTDWVIPLGACFCLGNLLLSLWDR